MADERARSGAGLEDELRALGRALPVDPPPAGLDTAVLARVADGPVPGVASRGPAARVAAAAGQWLHRHRRAAVAGVVAALLAVAAVSPASARIAQWLGLGGVVVVQAPSGPAGPAVPGGAAAEAGAMEVDLAVARERAAFPVGVPAALGTPDRVLLAVDTVVVSMEWSAGAGTVRLDQFAGSPHPFFVKKYVDTIEFATVGGAAALWLARPHPLVSLDAQGVERTDSARTSGPALVWQRGPVTLRLEGIADRAEAIAVAESVQE